MFPGMPNARALISGALLPSSLSAGLGAGLAVTVDGLGASPAALCGAVIAAACGGAVGALAPSADRRWVGAALAGLGAVAAALSVALPTPGPYIGAAAAGATWIYAARPAGGAASLAGMLLAGPALVAGLLAPAPAAVAGWLLLAAAPSRDPERDPERAPAALTGALEAALFVALGAALVTAAWAAGRASLDPTPAGFALAASVCLVVGVAASVAPRQPGTPWPLGAVAALATPALIGRLPALTLERLVPLAGSADPRAQIAALGALLVAPGALLLALAWRPASASRLRAAPALAALGVGCFVGLDAGAATWSRALWIASAAGAVGLLRPGGFPRRLASLAIGGAAVAARIAPLPWPEVELLSGWTYQLRDATGPDRARQIADRLTPVSGGWGPGGAVLLKSGKDEELVMMLDGLPIELESRAAAAELMAGHLAGALAAGKRRATVLGDDLGLVVRGLVTQGVERVDVAVPDVDALRALVAARPDLGEVQFNPAVRHVRGSGDGALRWAEPQDAIVEVARTPWPDAHQGLPGPGHLARRAAALAPGGLYLLVVPVTWLEREQLMGLFGDFTDAFAGAWAFLPPTGGDQLLLAGWNATPRVVWDRALLAMELGVGDLSSIEIRSAMDLADRAVVNRDGLLALAGAAPARSLYLTGILHRRPRMNMPLLLPSLTSAAGLFEVTEVIAERLDDRKEANAEFLELLSAASEGRLDEVFTKGQQLSKRGSTRSLETVIAPNLERARGHISRGRAEGPSSPGWAKAIQELQGALLIAPGSPAAQTLLGECYLEQGILGKARDAFKRALETDEAYFDALSGMARVAVVSGDRTEAELYFNRAAERHPENWQAHYDLGVFLMESGRYEEAELRLRKASKLDPSRYHPHLSLGELYIQTEKPNQALGQGDLAVAREENPLTYFLRGRAYYLLDQVDAASRDFSRAILIDGSFYKARGALCFTSLRMGDYQQAAAFAREVLAQVPGEQVARECLEAAEAALEPPQGEP
jgi:tetratricopeptide (TPR) repeat protein